MKCSHCSKGTMKKTTIDNYKTKMNGKDIIVPTAHIKVCDSCGYEVYPAKELKIWENIASERKYCQCGYEMMERNKEYICSKCYNVVKKD